MSKSVEYVSIVMMRELLNVQKETIMSFFKETVKDFNLKVEALQQNINGLSHELREIKTGMNFVGDLCEEKIKMHEEKVKQASDELFNIKKIQGKIFSDNSELKIKSVDIEDRNRRCNLRIDGLKETIDEKECESTKEKVKKLFNDKLGIKQDIKIERAHRVVFANNERARTIVLKLHDFEGKKIILDKAFYLKEIQMNLIDTPYFNPFDFKVTKDHSSFSVLHLNIRSMQQNIEKLKEFLRIVNYAFDVIALTETWHDTESYIELNTNYKLPSYNLISQPRASGYDEIPSNQDMIKYLAIFNKTSLNKALFHILKLSLKFGVFPDALKIAKVIPIYKGNDHSNITNYRPISLLSVFSKLFERVIYNRIFEYITKNNLFYPKQFGFQKNHSTEHAIVEIVNQITDRFDNNKFTLGVFIDLSKAFDTVDHCILLPKIKQYGIINTTYFWIKSFLTDRKKYVHNVQPGILNVVCEVPQGSILGPLLFLIYINDFCNASLKLNSIIFADDTNLFLTNNHIKHLHTDMNIELNKVNRFKANKLTLNVEKTNYTLIHNKNSRIKHSS
ncbi:uncharacterized protein LOC136072288 [Hydra vulgaris]|uniref:uncharacterized protein LOC136072288 n=1 Tax=Hydra vulgaris TaxID=6087 RepID=UPI0032EA6A01